MRDEVDIRDLVSDEPNATEQLAVLRARGAVRRFRVRGMSGPVKGMLVSSTGERLSMGSHASNDMVIDDSAVSRFHCEVQLDSAGMWLVDLDSRNGTTLDGVPVGRGGLRDGSTLQLGRSVCRFELTNEQNRLPLSERTSFGPLVGQSLAMRGCFALLERASASDITVLLEGETGTGKEGAAAAIHNASARADKPLCVVDCGAMPANLLESELFGHERGAFTGATAARVGVFEQAHGGTVFLDEIGELSLALQPKLLRVLEQRQVRPLGSSRYRAVDVRIIAATHRDLRALVNENSFRSDLYFRLAVFGILLPPLRGRPDDMAMLATRLLDQLGADRDITRQLLSEASLARMQAAAWPGNVRELRNYLERCAVMQTSLPTGQLRADDDGDWQLDLSLPYRRAKRQLLDQFERRYLSALLDRHQGNVSAAARAAGMDRVYVYKLLRRHNLGNRG
ncbi:MAG TPA: FHA domain-containing protein [Sorangium sp.]|nr:FHA domain-containing protein [Sorangium sp.]